MLSLMNINCPTKNLFSMVHVNSKQTYKQREKKNDEKGWCVYVTQWHIQIMWCVICSAAASN